jgi:hypothetical protein
MMNPGSPPPAPPLPALRSWLWAWLGGLALSPVLAIPLVRLACGGGHSAAIAAGLCMAALNGMASGLLGQRAVGANPERFRAVGIVGNVLRIAALLGILLAVRIALPERFNAFALSTVAGALAYMVTHVIRLSVRMNKDRTGA